MNTHNDAPFLALTGVRKAYGSVEVLHDIELSVADGEFITILGPSGSGKTTILRLIGGFTDPSSGRILLEGRDLTATPINRRPFNTVFQDYALFPHMTVEGNVGYGLRVRGTPRGETARRVRETLDLVQLAPFAKRMPAQLSGGQRQRVALARAIVNRPRAILLDEPLAALDLELRRQMQVFLKSIQKEIRTTFLFITHDQEEAIAMADRICVMNRGRIEQIGSPQDVYMRPKGEFVARFFGENNLVAGQLASRSGDTCSVATAIGPILCSTAGQPDLSGLQPGAKVFAMFRPESITFAAPGADHSRVAATVSDVAFAGSSTSITMAPRVPNAPPLRSRQPNASAARFPAAGAEIDVFLPAEACRVVPA